MLAWGIRTSHTLLKTVYIHQLKWKIALSTWNVVNVIYYHLFYFIITILKLSATIILYDIRLKVYSCLFGNIGFCRVVLYNSQMPSNVSYIIIDYCTSYIDCIIWFHVQSHWVNNLIACIIIDSMYMTCMINVIWCNNFNLKAIIVIFTMHCIVCNKRARHSTNFNFKIVASESDNILGTSNIFLAYMCDFDWTIITL